MCRLNFHKQVCIYAITVALSLISLSCSSNKHVAGTWNPEPLVVDGKGAEWETLSTSYNDKIGAVYGVVNDESGIHVMVRFNDARTVRRINRFGMVLWFNSGDSKDSRLGIRYASEDRAFSDNVEIPRKRNDVSENKPVQLKGIYSVIDTDTTLITAARNRAISTAAASDNGLYCFEVSVPYSFGEKFNSSPGETIKLGIELSGMPKEIREQMRERMSARRGGGRAGGGGARGGRPGGGRAGGSPEGRRPDLEKKDVWINLNLAQRP
ncbi:MAG: hypothetical protein ACRBF0_15885 [Calditrichia bacterium]